MAISALRNLICSYWVLALIAPPVSIIGVAFAQGDMEPPPVPPPPPPPPPSSDQPPSDVPAEPSVEDLPEDNVPPPDVEPPPEAPVEALMEPATNPSFNSKKSSKGSKKGGRNNSQSSSAQKVSGDTAKVVIEDKKGAEAIPPGQELVNMDFPEPTEIKDIIRAVALWTGKNVILDRNVSGKIQIISPKRVTKEEAYQAFLSALNVLQFTTVETGKIIKIMPIRSAIKGNLRTFLGSKWTPLTDEIITQIVPLKYVDSKSIQNTLTRIISPNSIVAYEKTNTLIISDSGYKVRRILDILDLIDVQGQQPQVAFVPIRFADAKTIVDRVTEILKANSSGGGSYGVFKLMLDERSNSVVVFGPPRTISDVQSLIKKFDIELDDPSRQASIHVRPLEYADAKKIATTLSSLAQGNKKKPGFSAPVLQSGGGDKGSRDTGSATAELDDNTKITADESSNSLLITGSRAAYQSVNSIIRKLDVRRSQVFVEADILDLTVDNRFQFGTSIFGGTKAGQNPVITTWQGKDLAGVIGASAVDTKPTVATATASAQALGGDLATIGILSNTKVNIPGIGEISPGALIKMIKSDTNTRVLSSPHIMTANNEEAKIVVGEKIFFKSSEANATTGVSIPKVEKEDVDLSLSIKPNISNSNYVTMKVDIEASNPDFDPETKLPRIKKRKTSQVMTVKNAQTVVVSGLVASQESEAFQKIPLLGDIPILGWLFRNSTLLSRTSNMVIFITPHIIHGAEDLAAIYQTKVKERDEYMEYIYGEGYKDDKFYALMPKLEDGVFRADQSDIDDKARRDETRRALLDQDMPLSKDDNLNSATREALTTPVPVPMNAGIGGGGGGGDSGGGSMAPPPPPSGPVDGMDMDMPPEPPPPPPEPAPVD
jgi:general secretion pathway protein D